MNLHQHLTCRFAAGKKTCYLFCLEVSILVVVFIDFHAVMLDNVLLENLLNSEPRCTIRFLAVEFTLLTPLKPIFSDYFTAARLRFPTHSYLYCIRIYQHGFRGKMWHCKIYHVTINYVVHTLRILKVISFQ